MAGHPPSRTRAAVRRQGAMALGGLAALVACSVVVDDGRVSAPERRVFRAINDLPEWLYPPLWPFQQFGNLVVALVLAAAVALLLRRWWVAGAVVVATVAKLRGEIIVKDIVQRARPGTSIGDVNLHGDVHSTGLSFVSGHAVMTAAMAGLLTPILPGRWKAVPWVIVVMNGFTRIYVGAHNPLDIVGGVGLGLLIAGVLNLVLLAVRPAALAPARAAGGGPADDRPGPATTPRGRLASRRSRRTA